MLAMFTLLLRVHLTTNDQVHNRSSSISPRHSKMVMMVSSQMSPRIRFARNVEIKLNLTSSRSMHCSVVTAKMSSMVHASALTSLFCHSCTSSRRLAAGVAPPVGFLFQPIASRKVKPSPNAVQKSIDAVTREVIVIKSNLQAVTQMLTAAHSYARINPHNPPSITSRANIVNGSKSSNSTSDTPGSSTSSVSLFGKDGCMAPDPSIVNHQGMLSYSQVVQSCSNKGSTVHPPSSQLDDNLRSAVLTAVHTELNIKSKRSNNVVVTGKKPSTIASDGDQFLIYAITNSD